jgi:hypothetical protein
MTHYDIFNGDADGICALHQLRLHNPQDCTLITGLKRDINLLDQIKPENGDQLTVLDISLDRNRLGVERAIAAGSSLFYADHHYAGDQPLNEQFPILQTPGSGQRYQFLIDTTPDTCTSLIINQYLNGAERIWAVVGAYGDNLFESAQLAAEPLKLSHTQHQQLKELGTLINYNGYGSTLNDLVYHPAELYRTIHPYRDPFQFITEVGVFRQLQDAYHADMQKAEKLQPAQSDERTAIFILPNQRWARRVNGVFGNRLAQENPNRAHAVLIGMDDGSYRVSVRSPLTTKIGADELCRQFDTGGGRQAAAGINQLAANELEQFARLFTQQFSN